MNIVEDIEGRLTPEALAGLAARLEIAPDEIVAPARGAAVALLAALSTRAGDSAGAAELAGGLAGRDPADLRRLLADDPAAAEALGRELLTEALPVGALPPVVAALATHLGIGPGQAETLLASLTPLVLGTVARRLRPTAEGVAGLFEEQKEAIVAATPPGLTPAAPVSPRTYGWVAPVAALAVLAVAIWYFLGGEPENIPPPRLPATPATA